MKIFCVGKNYAAHAAEMNSKVPDQPLIFMKPDTALLPSGQPFFYPDFSNEVHYECELVVKVSEAGKSIKKENAWNHIGDVTLGIDFTARDIQSALKAKGHPWEIAKAFDYSAAIGVWQSMTPDQIKDSSFSFYKNGEEVQHGSISDMMYDIPTVVEYISARFTLKKGDLIYTGTPEGVGPVVRGDQLKGKLNDTEVLYHSVK